MHTQAIPYDVAGITYIGYLARPDGVDRRAGVLICHEGNGLGPQVKERAHQLAELGYVAFAVDYIGGGEVLQDLPTMMARNAGDAAQIRGKILACIGADDPLVPAEERLAFEREMRATKVDWRLELYGNAVHGFANPNAGKLGNPAVQYHEPSHRRSWRSMLELFGETIGTR